MNPSTLVVTAILSLFSTAVMSYLSMAVPIGPWISPTIALCAMICFSFFKRRIVAYHTQISVITVAGSIGGIIATACGFSFPTLYFLDAQLFQQWVLHPSYFIITLGCLALVAGWFGIWMANILQQSLMYQAALPFPIGMLLYKMIGAHTHAAYSGQLVAGFVVTIFFCGLQQGIGLYQALMPRFFLIIPTVSYSIWHVPAICLDGTLLPMLIAIGCIAGYMIALPLMIGAVMHIILVKPLHLYWFPEIISSDFLLAFCSGMVLFSSLSALIGMIRECPPLIVNASSNISHFLSHCNLTYRHMIEGCAVIAACMMFFTYFSFSFCAQWYLLVGTFICSHQIAIIAGKIGLAPLGRFATFVMVPALFVFQLNIVQIVLLSTFVEIAGGVTADVLFGRKLAHEGEVPLDIIQRYQYMGLLFSCLVIGIIFWLLVSHFQLGSPELFAQKAYARRLLIQVKQFHLGVLLLGALFGLILQLVRVNAMLVLGGLLMPLSISIGLIFGSLITAYAKNKEQYVPFWSGVFAANSLWMLLQALLCRLC